MRSIGVITVGRSDYGIVRPILRRIKLEPDLRLHLIVTAAHLAERFGMTVRAIEADGFGIGDRVEMTEQDDSPLAVARSIGVGFQAFSGIFARRSIDLLLVLGDRFEMHTAVAAAAPFTLPVAHIHGGESSEGSTDELYRHSITKMSHLHFVSTDMCRRRVIRMGEEPWRVTVTGAPALDNLREQDRMDARDMEKVIGMPLKPAPLLVTFHPVTLESGDTSRQIGELLGALEQVDAPIVFTYPNADAGHEIIIEAIQSFVRRHSRSRFIASLGTQLYFSLMSHAAAMVGNSSSGIVEAASFRLPVVNVGSRQRGRFHDRNVVDVDCEGAAILKAVRQVTRPSFLCGLSGLTNPYGDGRAAETIVRILKNIPLDRALIQKKFYDG
jgi:UDP-hydrolysing UDP-N-acetyl-D-glucosamine 2-epimerase